MRSAFPFSRKERRALTFILFVIVVMRVAFAFRTEEQIYTRPYGEDAYYLFSCAEHFSQGEGFTVDGVHPTNGVQPLIVVLYAPVFQIADFDKLTALRYIFGYAAIIDAITALLLARLVRTVVRTSSYVYEDRALRSPPVLAAALWGLLYSVNLYTTGGLETGLVSLFTIASLLLYANIHRMRRSGEVPSLKRWIALGIMLGITVLARVDTVMLVPAICLVEVLRYRERGIAHAFVIGILAVIVSAPWWWYNYTYFGNIVPQSGMAESLHNELVRNSWNAVTVLADSASVFFFLPKISEVPHWVAALWIIVVILALWYVNRKFGIFRLLSTNIHFFPLLPLVMMSIGFFVYYVFFFSAPHFIPRYFQPFRIFGVIFAAVALPHISEQVRHSRSARRMFRLFILIGIVFSALRYGYMFTMEEPNDFYKVGQWAKAIPTARIGMDQSGTTSFIAPNVTNLDGKVNFEALEARLDGDIGKYVDKEQFDYIADWPEFASVIVDGAKAHGTEYEQVDTIGRIHIYKRIP